MQQRSDLALPTSTYRLQLNEGFTFDDAVAQVPYLADLGVTHIFCSPILQAAPGSMHGYDVVDHTRISADCGGEAGFRRLADAAHAAGLGIVVDVVPNHMAVPTPIWKNAALWDVLRNGAASAYAAWFDVDLSSSRAVLMPVLGRRIGDELADGNIRVERRDVGGTRSRWSPTSTTSSRSGPAPRTFRSTNCWSGSGTGWPTGRSPTRSSTTDASSTSTPWRRCASRMTTCSTPPTNCCSSCSARG
ncbi:alpha-amylase family glycosyl hydrolase [Tessaracoccus aquimaris]|uniref:alpha-amylase family glycosyl hydrolase n=1 Tax=Tessaracoccus aquimaris TaxID=1332264 RepID=UPI000989363B|nr:alpha-amylase family glycosyl hydrolase [Tessaracoccus aquimaris]